MAFLDYQFLSKADRQWARKRANGLLRSVPAAEVGLTCHSARGALASVFMRPRNVIAVLVYDDDCGNWWGDVVLRRGDGEVQLGSLEAAPLRSREKALQSVKSFIASMKATRQHPYVEENRQRGVEPAGTELIRVRHEKFGCRWFPLAVEPMFVGANIFAKRVECKQKSLVDKLSQARRTVLKLAPRFASDSEFFECNSEKDKDRDSYRLFGYAAAFLSDNGVANVDSPNYGSRSAAGSQSFEVTTGRDWSVPTSGRRNGTAKNSYELKTFPIN
jgi:hypothetical protein